MTDDTPSPPAARAPAEGRAVLGSIAGFWTFQYLLILARIATAERPHPIGFGTQAGRWLLLMMLAAAMSVAIHRLLRRLPTRSFAQRVAAAGLLTLPAAGVFGAASGWLFYYSLPEVIAAVGPYQPYTLLMFWHDTVPWVPSFFSWTALYLALDYSFDVRDRERRLARVQALAHRAQVRALRYQINPHFLFNTLNSISSMIWEKELDRAEAMVVSLSDFLRTTLEIDPAADVTLAQEIALQKLYLEIEQTRFPDRLKVEFDVPDELGEARVPSLILQPLVENAIKYAVAPSKTGTRLRIAARRADDRLLLDVEDDGSAGAPPGGGTGLGLDNVRRRLAARFGEGCLFEAGSGSARGFRVTLGMPLQFV